MELFFATNNTGANVNLSRTDVHSVLNAKNKGNSLQYRFYIENLCDSLQKSLDFFAVCLAELYLMFVDVRAMKFKTAKLY